MDAFSEDSIGHDWLKWGPVGESITDESCLWGTEASEISLIEMSILSSGIESKGSYYSNLWCQLEDTVLLIGTLLLFGPVLFPKYEA